MSYPKFKVGEYEFQVIAREGATTYDVAVVMIRNGAQESWGGDPATRSVIAEDVTPQFIMDRGGRRAFIVWALDEGLKRARAHVESLKPPVPDKTTRFIENTMHHLQFSTSEVSDKSYVDVAPAPLP